MDLLQFTDKGIYCPAADVYLDPWKKVKRALISHAHSDHARWGSDAYLSHSDSEAILKYRLGNSIQLQTTPYNVPILINGVKFSFHPAGHIIGSAQIRVEYKGEVWVFTGDYKLENDGFSAPFESVKCHTLITESTFGLPVYNWQAQHIIFEEINNWWKKNAEQEICSVLVGYSLGKAQRILVHLDSSIGNIFAHGAISQTHDVLRSAGFSLPPSPKPQEAADKQVLRRSLILIPPSAIDSPWMKRFEPYSLAIASGWMGLRGARRRRSADRGFVLSDHADWQGLNTAVKESEAEHVLVTHGYGNAFAKWLCEQGINAREAKTDYSGETLDHVEEKELVSD
jgi:putative mRNA 3-end processing factor